MKHVRKGLSPTAFEDWKALANADWAPTYGALRNPEKGVLHQALLNEQGWVCCYCGRGISAQDSHIEHFRPQEHFSHLALDFDNLHASCIRETAPGAPLHCGHAKSAEFDETRHLSPLDASCETWFSYTLQGKIMATDARADHMVKLLRLDIPFLNSRREESIRKVFDPEFLDTVTPQELRQLSHAFRAWDSEGRAESFGHAVARFAEQRLLDAGATEIGL
jgi:uncharacterized protein (TIGR02646 family)